MIGGMQAPPKGDISKLWRLLGVDFAADQIVWQDYNPYPKASHFPPRVRLRRRRLRRQGAVQPERPDQFRACNSCSSPSRAPWRS